jgi:hypothetical protein
MSRKPLQWIKHHRAEVRGVLFLVLGCEEAERCHNLPLSVDGEALLVVDGVTKA